MKLFISALRFVVGRTLGAERYFACVLEALDELKGPFEIAVAGSLSTCQWVNGVAPGLSTITSEIPRTPLHRLLYEQVQAPVLARRWGATVAFFPFHTMPRMGLPSVLMVHDLVDRFYLKRFPGYQTLSSVAKTYMVRTSIKRARTIITPSRAISAEVQETGWVPPERLITIPEASVAVAQSQSRPVRLAGKPRFLLLQTGMHAPHKNHPVTVRALAELKRTDPHLFSQVKLVVTGAKGEGTPELARLAKELGVFSNVDLLGHVEQSELEWLTEQATIMVFPSLYEGFGLGVIEAQLRGKAVLASNIPVFREVSRGLAGFFNPDDPKDLASAIKHLLGDPAARRTLETEGPTYGRAWSWRDHGNRLLSVLEAASNAR